MTLNALDAVIGVVYLTPKERKLLRIDNAPDTPADSVRFRCLDEPRMGEEINVVGTYQLTPAPVDAAPVVPSRVTKLLGAPIDTIVAAVEATEEPYKSSPLSDDDIEELMSLDSRDRVMRALRAEHARRIDAATVRAPLHTEAPAIVVTAQGPIDVEEVSLVVGTVTATTTEGTTSAMVAEPVVSAEPPPPGKGEWRDGVLVPEDEVVTGSVPSIVDTARAMGVVVDDVTEPGEDRRIASEALMEGYAAGVAIANSNVSPAEVFGGSTGAAPASDAVSPAGGATVATDPTDDLPWPAVAVEALGSELVPAADPSTSSTPADAQPVAVEASGSEPTPTEPAKPEKVRPRGWCPACRQFLTVRADGTMMQHYTPDGAKGPDGKRIDCQGVGLTPAAERPPEPRLPLSVAMKVDPPVAPVVERPALVSASTDPVIVALVEDAAEVLSEPAIVEHFGEAGDRLARALESIREHDADAPPVAVRVPAPPPVRYVLGGSAPYGWAIIDLEGCAPMEREDGAVARWELREDAEAALVYVREHGELPGDVETAPEPTGDERRERWEPGPRDDMPGIAASQFRDFPHDRPVTIAKDATDNRPKNPLDALTRLVEEAKTRGVRIRIVIEPIE